MTEKALFMPLRDPHQMKYLSLLLRLDFFLFFLPSLILVLNLMTAVIPLMVFSFFMSIELRINMANPNSTRGS